MINYNTVMDLSYRGQKTIDFEKAITDYTGIQYVIATNTGTAALHLCYIVSGIKENEEVFVPSLTFVGTVNPLSYIGAIPHFVDIDDRLGIHPEKLMDHIESNCTFKDGILYNKQTGRKISAIVPVHLLGNPCNMTDITVIANRLNLKVIEDSCQALGSKYCNTHVGDFSDCSALSFNGNKIITTGGGGAFLTNDYNLYQKALHLSMVSKDYSIKKTYHNSVGYNYRMSAYNAILGLKQLKNIKSILKQKLKIKQAMNECYDIIQDRPNSQPNNWKVGFISDKGNYPAWEMISNLPMYKDCPKANLENTEYYNKYLYLSE
jgi:perosamine synthetase